MDSTLKIGGMIALFTFYKKKVIFIGVRTLLLGQAGGKIRLKLDNVQNSRIFRGNIFSFLL